jgi:hypothetical protein
MFRRLFGRSKASSAPALPDEDALALRSLQNEWQCTSCGDWHRGIMHLAADHPDPWPHGTGYEPNSALRTDGDFLSEDFCVLDGEHFMVRCVLELPVAGLDEPWTWGCWSSLSRENFDKYVAGFDSGEYEDDGPWFGWLCNTLPPLHVEGDSVALEVWPQSDRQRPLVVVEDHDHPLAIAQKGLSVAGLVEVLRASGHGPTTH